MQPVITQEFSQFNCVNILNRLLELAMQTAEAASEDKNHRLVLQAVREVTRLVTLINKITSPQNQKPQLQGKPAIGAAFQAQPGAQTGKWEKCGKIAGKIGVLEEFFKNNLPVSSCKKNNGVSGPAGAHRNTPKPCDRAAGAIRWQDEPVVLAAEESKAA